MTEKEKCASGMLYDANYDPTLINERNQCAELTFQYNALPPSKQEERSALLKHILGKMGDNVQIIPPFFCDYGYNIEVGNEFFMNMNCVILDGAKVTFGNHVFIGPNSGFYTAGHPLNKDQRNVGLEYAKPITVGNNVWIGAQVCVLPGVTIGDNVVIGAGSVVTKDIPANVLAYGNPCRVVREIE
ncbi:MAG: sugar O-acetyltransferase [Bacteroidaceae bacterium]|nr:sugar O-acetyltransferase [Bacteroidaceae bacterium]